jgi:hypothetical protein
LAGLNVKTFSVAITESELFNSLAVCSRTVSLVLVKSVNGELLSQLLHIIIPKSFSENTGSSYIRESTIPLNHTNMGDRWKARKSITINQ